MAAKKSPKKAARKATKKKAAKSKRTLPPKPKTPGKSGPRLSDDQRAVLLQFLAAGERESSINQFFVIAGWGSVASSTLAHYRKLWAKQIAAAAAARIDDALTTGLALRAERVAVLKEHAEQLAALRWQPSQNGRLWNERAFRQTLDDIAVEMGDRRRRDDAGDAGEVVKVYLGIDPERV